MKSWKTFSVLLFFLIAVPVKAQDYAIKELSAEETSMPKPLSITGVAPFDGGLRLFINTDDPSAIANLLAEEAFQAQLSDHETDTETLRSIALGKAVRCTSDAVPFYLGYQDPSPDCGGQSPAAIEYFFSVAAVLGPNRDLAIGVDPDFMWLIEER